MARYCLERAMSPSLLKRIDWSTLVYPAGDRNLAIIDKLISLGGKSGINDALVHVASATFVMFPELETTAQLAEFEETQLAMMKLLIEGGADVNYLVKSKYDRSPLTEAINSLQIPRVELLLKHGANDGDLDFALQRAEATAVYYGSRRGQTIDGNLGNLAEIKKLLADKGIKT